MSSTASFNRMVIHQLNGVGPKTAEKLHAAGIITAADLLFHLPTRYQDRTCIQPITTIPSDTEGYIEAEIIDVKIQQSKKPILICHVRDLSGHLSIKFFYFNSRQKQNLMQGEQKIRCYGKLRRTQYGLEMIHPDYELFPIGQQPALAKTFTPIYPAIEGVSQPLFRKLIAQLMPYLQQGLLLEDLIPPSLLEQQQLLPLSKALNILHQPDPLQDDNIQTTLKTARKRLVFEELVTHRLSVLVARQEQIHKQSPTISEFSVSKQLLETLPYQLTKAQQRVLQDIQKDLQQKTPMLRLIQGDVGSGKTIVAALAAVDMIANQQQVALMVPTELLAEQHHQNLEKLFLPFNINTALLTSKITTEQRQQVLHDLQAGLLNCVIGTHSLFQDSVVFSKLGLVIIDEQHRFGVDQRYALLKKGQQNNDCPHLLVMTATPIPRTLAMVLYADLDCSIIDELPPGRKPVQTVALPNHRRQKVIERIQANCEAGKQVYWICTLVADSDNLQAESAEQTAKFLQQALPNLRIGLVHGKIKSSEKSAAIKTFAEQSLDLLVATTVIEVGIDVANASLMIIENPERLGLAQLHQLRGRVGRGEQQSYCVLLYQSPLTDIAEQRLQAMREHVDGFQIAEIDLKLRGPGELLGTRQTGDWHFRLANLITDAELLPQVSTLATAILQNIPQIIEPLRRRWLPEINSENFLQS